MNDPIRGVLDLIEGDEEGAERSFVVFLDFGIRGRDILPVGEEFGRYVPCRCFPRRRGGVVLAQTGLGVVMR